ncbi:2-octaprenyl-6-methoxyphenyl hydroxylase [Nitratireductor aquibiodomus RA22]|uniref:2-octaprenyl-6-methoxyphenyl hydroxylase n=1 Tax=Nitratireductor aquibiodomus RA22 TaxID=1189611 RepID=I5BTC8_9HYPH|nr:UbiH/UbiF family hydroxylase [Nitratireductor aquibiodomus]EIM72830.1 2-octaprenyl-6-methoxyphenyl hydroxylase [Nitratireductor aquibiodomus RA22]
MSDRNRRILVAGTGPAGLIAALMLAHHGHAVTLVGPVPEGRDRRTVALMRPSLDLIEPLGILDRLLPETAPLRAMRLVDATGRLIRSPTVTFHAGEIGEEFFGLNIPNARLTEELAEAARTSPLIDWHESLVEKWACESDHVTATLRNGERLVAQLAVAADGRGSPAREAAGISAKTRALPQAALVLNFKHAREHGFVSTEFHTQSGPCTQVPLPGMRSSLVWVLNPEDAETMNALGDEELSRRVEERLSSMLGRVTVEPGRQIYPLGTLMPSRFGQNRVALVGEAAHVFPPISAQGLNLGIRDVEDLVAVASAFPDDPGSPAAMSRYHAARRPDILARSNSVNLLNASLLSGFLPAQIARSAGLSVIGSIPPLRALFMREGMRPGSGFSALLPFKGKGPAAGARS